ncbi:hypothetical protein RLIN73S_02409 [Rhodanobacter lindaniclasticus]
MFQATFDVAVLQQAQAEQIAGFPILRIGLDALLQRGYFGRGLGGVGQFEFAAQALRARVGGEVGRQRIEFGAGGIGLAGTSAPAPGRA